MRSPIVERNNTSSNNAPHRAIKKVIMKTLGERDNAAQETIALITFTKAA